MPIIDVLKNKGRILWDFIFSKNKQDVAIGLSIGHSNVIAVEVERKANEYKILNIASREIGSDKNIAALIKDIFTNTKFTTDLINASISGSAVITRFINFPYMNKKDLRNSLEFEAENYIPFNLSEVILDYCILGEKKDDAKRSYSLALVAARKEAIDGLHGLCRDAGIQLYAIDIDSFACFNLYKLSYGDGDDTRTVALINIGSELTTITILHNGTPAFTRDLVFGGMDITKKISKAKNMSLEETEKFKLAIGTTDPEIKKIIAESLSYLIRELKLSFNFFKNQVQKGQDIDVSTLYFLGGSSGLTGLCDIIHAEMGITATLFDPVKKFVIGESVDLQAIERLERSLAVPLGLAIRRA